MNPTLFPYQIEGADWLASKRHALLADDMGLGKSAQAIRACDGARAIKVLVICPAVARVNWEREFSKFAHTRRAFTVVKDKKFRDWRESVICSYDLVDQIPESFTFDALIIDESHFLKSTDAKRSRLVLGGQGLIHRAKRVWFISGTPAPNHYGELWPMLYTCGVTPLPYEKFLERYCNTFKTPFGLKVTGSKTENLSELRTLLKPFMLRRKKEDVMKQLPKISFHDIVVEPGVVDLETDSTFIQYVFPHDRRQELLRILDEQRKIIDDTVEHLGWGAGATIKALEALAKSVSTLRMYTGIQKVEPLAELIKGELENKAYEKIVIFAVHQCVIEGLRVRLAKFKPVTLYGGTPPEKRQRNIDKFQTDPRVRVFIGNIQAAGTAITLTAAHQVMFAEQSWVPGENAQAAMRVHRLGQTKPVTVRVAGLADSLDEKVSQTLKRKTRELTRLFDEGREEIRNSVSEPLPAAGDDVTTEKPHHGEMS